MTALIISNNVSYGQMTNQIIGRAHALNATIPRLQEGIATASSGFEGIPGTQFEVGGGGNGTGSLFGVQADPANPGQQGTAYSYAVGQLLAEWAKFWTAAEAYVSALDNGIPTY